ncbi:hypothetical protein APS67_002316 [Streptomyces sp. AVP053U2]|nr:hypothetical protein APS67_002316 [Streptomyces sp. AVP053U2]
MTSPRSAVCSTPARGRRGTPGATAPDPTEGPIATADGTFGHDERRKHESDDLPGLRTGGPARDGDTEATGGDSTAPDDVVLDDAFIRAAEPAEPSARARMPAERRLHEEPQPRRSDEPPTGRVLQQGAPAGVAVSAGMRAAGRQGSAAPAPGPASSAYPVGRAGPWGPFPVPDRGVVPGHATRSDAQRKRAP